MSLKKTPPCGLPVQINASVSGHCVGLLLLLLLLLLLPLLR